MKKRVCCIFNLAPHYRAPIYRLMDQELDCDFYFGDTMGNNIRLMDYESLKGFKKIVKNIRLTKTGFMWQLGVWKLIFKPYKHYIITGSPAMVSSWVLAILAILFRKNVYAWSHGMMKPAETKGEIFRKTFYKVCNKMLLYSNLAKKVMIKEGFKENKLITIYNSLDYENQLEVRKTLSKTNIYKEYFKNDSPVLIHIGRIQKSKKLDMLVLALKKLKEENLNCNLILVGANVENNSIHELVSQKGLTQNVWFYGQCYDEKTIGNLFYNADLCVSPGPIGLTALHSFTYGCPVVTNNEFEKQGPEHEIIQPGVNGDFFNNDDVEDLLSVIKKWINLEESGRRTINLEANKIVDEKWNPKFQLGILKSVLKI